MQESSAIKLSSNFEPINPDDDYVGSILKRFKSQLPIEKPLSSELQVELNKVPAQVFYWIPSSPFVCQACVVDVVVELLLYFSLVCKQIPVFVFP